MYLGADFTTLRATWRSVLIGYVNKNRSELEKSGEG